MRSFLFSIFCLGTIFACEQSEIPKPLQNTNPTDQTFENPHQDGFKNFDSWPTFVKARRVGTQFKDKVLKVKHDSFGNIWVLREAIDQSGNAYSRFLEKYSNDGVLLLSISEPANTFFSAFAVHQSGEITLAETRRIPSKKEKWGRVFHIWFKRLSPDGKILFEEPLTDPGSEKERTHYDFDDETGDFQKTSVIHKWEVDEVGHPSIFSCNYETLVPVGEDVYFLARTHGVKLYRLNQKFEVLWNQQVIPSSDMHYGLRRARQELLSIDDKENVFILSTFSEIGVIAWEKHFDSKLPREENDSSLFVAQFNSNGEFKGSRVFCKTRLSPAGFSVGNGILTVGATRNIRGKLNNPNNTREWDLVFFRAKLSSGELLAYKEIHLQRDDYANDFQVDPDGNGFFAGHNDFVQVDTNSTVEFGQGFILKVNEHGDTLNYATFKGSRKTSINSISLRSNELAIGGEFNAPITHTADQDKALAFSWGFLGRWDAHNKLP